MRYGDRGIKNTKAQKNTGRTRKSKIENRPKSTLYYFSIIDCRLLKKTKGQLSLAFCFLWLPRQDSITTAAGCGLRNLSSLADAAHIIPSGFKRLFLANRSALIRFESCPENPYKIQKPSFMLGFCILWLPGQDSNLRHCGYDLTPITWRVGLYHHHGISALGGGCLVSAPSMNFSVQGLAQDCPFSRVSLNLPAFHLNVSDEGC